VLMFMVVLLVSIIDWVVRGRKVYTGPVTLTEGYKGE
jgi:choline transport protein